MIETIGILFIIIMVIWVIVGSTLGLVNSIQAIIAEYKRKPA